MFTIIQHTAPVLENCMQCLDKRTLCRSETSGWKLEARKDADYRTSSLQPSVSSLQMLAITLGRMSDLFTKHAAEVGWILEADLRGHFGDAILGVTQQI